MRVLIVEDDPATRMILERLLVRGFGCEVAEAGNGREGLASMEQQLPDLILLDVQMPVMDGGEMLRMMRSTPSFRGVPVVSITAAKDQPTVQAMVGLGIEDYLLKPIDIEWARRRIEKVISRLSRPRRDAALSGR